MLFGLLLQALVPEDGEGGRHRSKATLKESPAVSLLRQVTPLRILQPEHVIVGEGPVVTHLMPVVVGNAQEMKKGCCDPGLPRVLGKSSLGNGPWTHMWVFSIIWTGIESILSCLFSEL